MSRTTDVIIIGSGLAGLMGAYSAAKNGASVKVISEGMGNLSISPGCIDLLGYDILGNAVMDPWKAIGELPADHPYSIVGKDAIEESLKELGICMQKAGCPLSSSEDADGRGVNSLIPTIMGTLKPTWLTQSGKGLAAAANAKRILIVGIKGFRDCKPTLIARQLARYADWEDKVYDTLILPEPFKENGRSLNALDLAHFADRGEGQDWLQNRLRNIGQSYDLVLLPPLLGAKPDSRVRGAIAEIIGCPSIEMLCVPPAVGGLRIRKAFVNALVDMGVEFYENAQVISATVAGNKCVDLAIHSTGRTTSQSAASYVVATGGVIGGGVILDQGKANEAIFGADIPVPEDVDKWTEPEIFGQHLISRLGVKTDNTLRIPELENVFFAGRTLGGYDWATEKSGHGVACSTGWQAGKLACTQAKGESL